MGGEAAIFLLSAPIRAIGSPESTRVHQHLNRRLGGRRLRI